MIERLFRSSPLAARPSVARKLGLAFLLGLTAAPAESLTCPTNFISGTVTSGDGSTIPENVALFANQGAIDGTLTVVPPFDGGPGGLPVALCPAWGDLEVG
jgi:hypothetical protein